MSRAVSWLALFDRGLGRFEWVVSALFLLVIVLSTGLGVFFRYAINNPLIWANDLGIVSLTWMTFFGGSALFKERGHIAVQALEQVLPVRVSTALAVFLTVLMGIGMAIIGWQMITLLPLQQTKIIEALEVPRSAYGLPLAWAASSIALSSVRQLLDGSLATAVAAGTNEA